MIITTRSGSGAAGPAALQPITVLARRATIRDGVAPFSEQPLLDLASGRESQAFVVAVAPGDHGRPGDQDRLIGAALVNTEAASAELLVHPGKRRRGMGTALLRAAAQLLPDPKQPLAVWAHGDLPAAAEFAASVGAKATRTLLRLRRSLTNFTAAPEEGGEGVTEGGPGVTVREFRPGRDDAAWLALNSRAFATHPEQGRWTQTDLDQRLTASWFTPKTLLLAESDGEVVSSVWVKPPDPSGAGELYVLAVDPDAQGRGLGRLMTNRALATLQGMGAESVVLWVDAENEPALKTYESTGFTVDVRDVQYTYRAG